jgi:hypothetical protein
MHYSRINTDAAGEYANRIQSRGSRRVVSSKLGTPRVSSKEDAFNAEGVDVLLVVN